MKRLYIIIIFFFAFFACQENEEKRYEGKDSVYFQISENWRNTVDSVVYSFVGKGKNVDTLLLRVNLQGDMTEHDRKFKCVVVGDKTSAVEGLHYESLEEYYIMPGNEVYGYLPVIIKKEDEKLSERSFQLYLELKESEDLDLGLTERTYVRIVFSDILNKPYYWDEKVLMFFGVYSRVKHDKCIELLNVDFPETFEEFNADRPMWEIRGKFMNNYFRENYVLDENNKPIEPWRN